ncbi:hypothetical protein SteCoe_9313 [Stentor coeruleus]|uniref:Centrosomal protein of 44 kDa n=1 Tax=Stentor coeruleus TaxID=5963 RepID=A0A1R2CI69_9CILI|nr:hypothetical protein SteCoe_9313 [Stentor coeruleus]
MSLGDINNHREKLRAELRAIKYTDPVDLKGLTEGEASSMLPIIHYLLLSYSKVFAEYIVDQGFDIMSKNDFCFMESVFKLMRNKFNYQPVLKIGQFLSSGFAERKLMMVLQMIEVVKKKAGELQRYQQAEERKSRSPYRSVEDENIKVQTPPKPSSKIYRDPEEILKDYSDILKKNKFSIEQFNETDNVEVQKEEKDYKIVDKNQNLDEIYRIVAEVIAENRMMKEKISEQEEKIKKMDKKLESQTALLQLISSKVKVLENSEKKEFQMKSERKNQDEGLLSKLGIPSGNAGYRAYIDKKEEFYEES